MTSSRTAPDVPVPWRVRLYSRLWKIAVGVGSFIIFSLGSNVLAAWVLSSNGVLPADSPLMRLVEWVMDRWTIVLPIGICFLLLALLFKMGSRLPIQNTASLAPPDGKNRAFMLQRLRHNYCELMAQSLQGAAWLKLGFAHKPDAVQNATTLLLRQSNQPERLFPRGTSILQVYKKANEELLILGEPGCGKSTQLYALALHLVEQADNDQARPLPIVFSLSSWATSRLSLEKWMEEQLSSPLYDVPHRVSKQWVQNEQILPLLDGLDEMNETIRPSCIAEINTYHHNHLQPMVVCSRSAEYAAALERLAFQSAVVVQPLDKAQVETILAQGGKVLTALRAVYKKNVALQELATTPLMLNLLILTYQGVQVHDLPTKEDVLQQQLLTNYVQRMIEFKGGYSHQQTYSWLHWLAGQMRLHQQTVFILEQLQPNWLPQRVRALYHRSIRMIGGPLFGLIGALGTGLLGVPIGMLIGVLINRSISALIGGLLGVLLGGLLFGLVGWLLFGQGATIKLAEKLAWSWKEARRGLIVGLPVGLFGGSLGTLIGGFLSGPPGGLVGGLLGGLLGGLFVGFLIFQLKDGFQLFPHVEYRRLLRNGSLIGLLVGGLVGPLIGLFEALFMGLGLVEGLLVGLIGGLAGGLFGGLFVGFSNTQLNDRFQLSSQKKYRRSMRNRLLFGLLTGLLFGLPVELLVGVSFNLAGELFRGLLFGLVGGLAGGLIGGLISGFSTSQQLNNHSRVSPHEGYRRSKRYALAGGLPIGLVSGVLVGLVGGLLFGSVGSLLFGSVGGLAGGLPFGLLFGLSAVIQHNTLRFRLWRAQLFPWNAVNFLEDARARHLLLRVGGSYSFTHQLLLDYFADLDLE